MQPISVFLDIGKFTDFQWKNADVSWAQILGSEAFLPPIPPPSPPPSVSSPSLKKFILKKVKPWASSNVFQKTPFVCFFFVCSLNFLLVISCLTSTYSNDNRNDQSVFEISSSFTKISWYCWKSFLLKYKISPLTSSLILTFDFGNLVGTLLQVKHLIT